MQSLLLWGDYIPTHGVLFISSTLKEYKFKFKIQCTIIKIDRKMTNKTFLTEKPPNQVANRLQQLLNENRWRFPGIGGTQNERGTSPSVTSSPPIISLVRMFHFPKNVDSGEQPRLPLVWHTTANESSSMWRTRLTTSVTYNSQWELVYVTSTIFQHAGSQDQGLIRLSMTDKCRSKYFLLIGFITMTHEWCMAGIPW